MNNKTVIIIILLIIFSMVLTLFLYKSDNFDIQNIEIIMEQGDCPQSFVEEINKLKGQNLLFLNKKTINNIKINNALIESIQIKRDFPKNLRIYLKKSPVNAIISYYEDSAIYYSIIDGKLQTLNGKDITSLEPSVTRIESDKDSVIYLKESGNLDLFLSSIDVIKANSYLISGINYSNNGIIGNQYFDISIDSINSVFRFRESFDEESFKNALKIAKDIYNKDSYDYKIILDIYHGAIVERH
jgi:hypothetical protein